MLPTIRPLTTTDQPKLAAFLQEHWGADLIVSRGQSYRAHDLGGFVAEAQGEWLGLLSLHIDQDHAEIVSLDSLRENVGIGTALIAAATAAARQQQWRRLWLITTNDNVRALRFYQRRGFVLCALHPNAVAVSRQIKPSIPLIGYDNIPIRDEIELEWRG